MPDAIELLSTRSSFKAVELKAPGPSAAEIDKLLSIAKAVTPSYRATYKLLTGRMPKAHECAHPATLIGKRVQRWDGARAERRTNKSQQCSTVPLHFS